MLQLKEGSGAETGPRFLHSLNNRESVYKDSHFSPSSLKHYFLKIGWNPMYAIAVKAAIGGGRINI
jgi:hypothetical protein